jgi:hypothetical protein
MEKLLLASNTNIIIKGIILDLFPGKNESFFYSPDKGNTWTVYENSNSAEKQ